MKIQISLEIPEGELSGNDETFLKSELFGCVEFMTRVREGQDFDYSLKCDEVRGEQER